MAFTENKGQVADMEGKLRPDILYTSDGGGMSIFIRNTGISYVLHKEEEHEEESDDAAESLEDWKYYTHRVDADFIGCNPSSIIEKKEMEEGYKNFYFPHCKDGITYVKSYRTLIQKNVYNNIDLVYKGNKSEGMKYDIVVNPGGNPNDVKIEYKGADNLQITNEGALQITTSLGELNEWMPRVYQNINGEIIDIKAQYVLTGNIVSLQLNTYNLQLPLIIDPWITYYGGSGLEEGIAINTDPNGNVVFTGFTTSTNFPLLGAFQTLRLAIDAYVTKIDEAGTLQWSTYYGGLVVEIGFGICTDSNGDVYVSGLTSSITFPVGAAGGQTSFLGTYPGKESAFLVKFSANGTRLWATFYGDASGNTKASSVTTDQTNDVILYGQTAATNNIATAGSFQTSKSADANPDAFIAKFSSTGNRIWASYFGGPEAEESGGIDCDAGSNIFIAGTTKSNSFPTFQAHQSAFGGGESDAFLVKLNAAGSRLWSTYFGGNGKENHDIGAMVEVDLNGDVYLGGITASTNNIASMGAFQTTFAPDYDGFLAKFSSTGVQQWATYLGGSTSPSGKKSDAVTGIAIDNNNNVIVAGDTYSTDFPVTSCAYQATLIGEEDQFLTALSPNGDLICSGFLGKGTLGSHNETYEGDGFGGCLASSGKFIYLIATTENSNYDYSITTNTTAGGRDVVVSQLCPISCGIPQVTANFSMQQTVACRAGDSINFIMQNSSCDNDSATYVWTFESATPSSSTEQNPTNIIYNTEGSFDVSVIVSTPCTDSTIIKENFVDVGKHLPVASFTATPQPTSLASPTISFINQSTGSVQWEWNFGDVAGASSDQQNPYFTYSDSGNYIVRLVATNQYGCTDTIEHLIRIEDALSFYAPNTFTPNGDNINDVFSPKHEGIINGDYLFTIYDRWGQLVFFTTDPGKGWNGKANGGRKLAQIDTYVWKVQLKDKIGDKHEYIGHVNLIR